MRLIGKDGDEAARQIAEELETRKADGQRFVIPATAIVETGNLVAQQRSGRRRLAERLRSVLEEARSDNPPWIIRAATLDEHFIQELLDGNSTGSDLVTLLGNGSLGTGDVALLVETRPVPTRDRLRARRNLDLGPATRVPQLTQVPVWQKHRHRENAHSPTVKDPTSPQTGMDNILGSVEPQDPPNDDISVIFGIGDSGGNEIAVDRKTATAEAIAGWNCS